MIFALTAFVAAVTAAVWIAVRPAAEPENINNSRSVSAEPAEAAGAKSPFFYKSIGNAPDAAPGPETAQATTPPMRVTYTLELKVAATRDEAESMIDDLEARGIEAYYTPLSRQGQVVYRVRRGVFPDQKAAGRAAVALKEDHQIGARVVKLQ